MILLHFFPYSSLLASLNQIRMGKNRKIIIINAILKNEKKKWGYILNIL